MGDLTPEEFLTYEWKHAMRASRQSLLLLLLFLTPAACADDVTTDGAALVIDYAHHRDRFAAEAFAELFVEDGVLIIGDNRWEGRDAIRARIETLDSHTTIRHHMSSVRIQPIDADHAAGVSYAMIKSPIGN